jgi:hypothetical protein
MLATYGVDVLDPAVSLRRVKVLGERLPAGAWPNPEHALSWTPEAYLLAQLIDEVSALTYLTMRAHGGKPRRPKPFPRPGVTKKDRRPAQPRTSWTGLANTLTAQQRGVVVHGG